MNLLNTFVVNPMYRTLAYFPLLLLFLLHDRHRMPYKHRYLNILQVLSSMCLALVVVCNALAAVSYMASINEIAYIEEMVQMSSIVEMLLYGAVPLSLPVWMAWIRIENRLWKKTQ